MRSESALLVLQLSLPSLSYPGSNQSREYEQPAPDPRVTKWVEHAAKSVSLALHFS